MNVIAIDPGVNACGVATWGGKDVRPHQTMVFTASKKLTWPERVATLVNNVNLEFQFSSFDTLAIEWPEVMGGAVGNAAAKRGDVTMLAYSVGSFASIAESFGLKVQLVPVREWKGQLSKDVVEKRITRAIKGIYSTCGQLIKTHAWDAVGIGLHARGYPLDHRIFA